MQSLLQIMKKISLITFLTILFLIFSAFSTVSGQDLKNTTWKHPTEKVYIKFGDPGLEVWQVVRGRQCAMYPSIYKFNGDEIITDDGRGKNMKWGIEYVRKDDSMRINFPNGETVVYKSSSFYPRRKCNINGKGKEGV